MAIKTRMKSQVVPASEGSNKSYEALIRLWVLRLLVPLGGHNNFLTMFGYTSGYLAQFLDLPSVDDQFDMKVVMTELRKKHAQAERCRNSAALPETLARNIARYSQLMGWTKADEAAIAFTVLMETDLRLEFACDSIDLVTTTKLIDILSCVLEIDRDEIRNSVLPKSGLCESGFLKVDARTMNNLVGKLGMLSTDTSYRLRHMDGDPFELLRDVIAPAAPAELSLDDFAHIKPTLDVLQPYLARSIDGKARGVNVFIHGAPGTGKTQLALALAKELGCDLFEISSQNESGDGINGYGRLRALRAGQSMLRKRRAVILFDEAEDVFDGGWTHLREQGSARSQKAWMNRQLESNGAPVIWLSNDVECMDPAFLRRFDVVLEMPLLRGRQRERLIDEACGDLIDATARHRLVEARGLAPAVVRRAARVVRTIQDVLPANRTSAVLEQLIESTLEAQGHGGLTTGDAAALPPSYDPRHIAADVDLAQVSAGIVQARTGRICLYGPPGTGKTAFGRWLATQLDVPLHAKRVSDIVSPYVGQTERNLARVFREAEADGAVLLLDEVDSFLQDRRGAHRSWEVTEVNEMLTQMEGFGGVFIATTNLMSDLDQAALRRFDLKLRFGYLLPDQARRLFESQCRVLGIGEPTHADCQLLAGLDQLTPGDFAAAARQHRFRRLAAPADLVDALARECELKEGAMKKVIGFR